MQVGNKGSRLTGGNYNNMARIKQANKKDLLAIVSALFTVLTDDDLAELSGLKLRAFMIRKAKFVEKVREIVEEIK